MATWKNLTLASVFSGPAQTLQELKKEAETLSVRIDAVSRQLAVKADALQQVLSTTGSLIDGLTNTGVSVLYLEPSAGDLVSRISLSENPPQGNFSAGIVLGICAANISSVANTYEELLSILTSPVAVPK